jgi:hypothetical protein
VDLHCFVSHHRVLYSTVLLLCNRALAPVVCHLPYYCSSSPALSLSPIPTRIMSERSRSPSSPKFKDSDDEYDTKSMHSLSLDDSPKQRLAALSSLQDRVPAESLEPPRSPPIDASATITASLASIARLTSKKEHGNESNGGFKEEPLSPLRSPSPKHKVHDVPLSPVALGTTVGESRARETSSSQSLPQQPDTLPNLSVRLQAQVHHFLCLSKTRIRPALVRRHSESSAPIQCSSIYPRIR